MENVGSTLASAPHYMAQGINGLTAHGVEKAIDGLLQMLQLVVTGVEEVIIFAINVWTQTYLCLITMAVTGALHAVLDVTEDVANFINSTIGAIGKDLDSVINGFDNDLNKAISGFDKVFGAKIPTLNVSGDLDKLNHLQLPPGLDQGLQKLNSSIPNFDQVNNLTQTALRFPFEELKSLIANHTGNYTFNQSMFPVPQKQKLAFCSDDDSIDHFFNGLVDIEVTARKIAIAVLVLLAVGVIAPMTWWEIKRWQMMQNKAKYLDDHAYDSMDAVYVISRPYSSKVGIETAKRATEDYKRRTLIRWCIAYCTSTPALFVLSLGVAGLFSGLCHYFCLKALTHEVPQLTQQVDQFADKLLATVNNVSTSWANETNGVILDVNTKVNNDVFGWVNVSTTALNNTLNTATDEMIKGLNATFGGTVLYDPIMDVYNCLIGLKVAGIEKALTWVQDHAHIDFPLLPNNTFALSNLASKAGDDKDTDAAADFLSNPADQGSSAIQAVVAKLVAKIEKNIIQEIVISAVLVGVWLLVFVFGAGRTLWLFFRPHKTRGEGGQFWPSWVPRRGGPSGGSGRGIGAGALGSFRSRLGGLKSRFGTRSSTRSSALWPEKGTAFANTEEKRVSTPPLREGDANPFATPRLPDFDRDVTNPFHDPHPPAAEPTLPNVEDNTGANYRGQGYTLQPRPFPGFGDELPVTPTTPGMPAPLNPARVRTGSVSGGAVAPVLAHPRASWRPEVVGRSGVDSVELFGPRAGAGQHGGW